MNDGLSNESYLIQALSFAKQGLGQCAPNPAVGAVIVQGSGVIGTGFHHGAGLPHAEVAAIAACTQSPEGTTIYVTLEPCCHYGKTPPCTEAIIQAGITRVVFAHTDTNPSVAGKSQVLLEAAGIVVEHQLVIAIENFYQPYDHWRANSVPYVRAKLAVSQDNCTADSHGQPVAITGEACRRFTHEQRLGHDAIMTTMATVVADNPQLNVRLGECVMAKPIYILDRTLQFSLELALNKTAASITLFCSADVDAVQRDKLEASGIRCIDVPVRENRLEWHAMLAQIAQDGMHTLWLEAGAEAYLSLWRSGLCQQAYLYRSSKELGATPVVLPDFVNPKVILKSNEDCIFLYKFCK